MLSFSLQGQQVKRHQHGNAAEESERKKSLSILKPKRPNYFLSLRISHHSEAVKAIELVQESVVKYNTTLKGALVDPISAHLTLLVMTLETEDEVQHAVNTLEAMKRLPVLQTKLSLTLKGLSSFRNQVLYLDVHADDHRQKVEHLATTCMQVFQSAGLVDEKSGNHSNFTPHVTVAKLSKLRQRKQKGARKIGPGAYEDHIDIKVDGVEINEIQLCRMNGPKADDGFYYAAGSVRLGDENEQCSFSYVH